MMRQQSQAAAATLVTFPVARGRVRGRTALASALPVDAAPPATPRKPSFLHGAAYDGLHDSSTTLSGALCSSADVLSGGLRNGFRDGGSALGDRVAMGLIVMGALLGASNLAAAFVRRRRGD
jgi:hypothetical protein